LLDLSGTDVRTLRGLDRILCSKSGDDPKLRCLYAAGTNLCTRKGPNLPNLEILDISYVGLKKIPRMAGLSKLKKLDLSGNRIWIPENLGELEHLEHLSLAGNRLVHTLGLENLKNLRVLDLTGNNIGAVYCFDKVHFWEGLYQLYKIHVEKRMPKPLLGIAELSNLEELYVGKNKLRSMYGLRYLPSLLYADFSSNKITKISDLQDGAKLTDLDLSGNRIEEFEGLEWAISLKRLDVSENNISDFAEAADYLLANCLWARNQLRIDITDNPVDWGDISNILSLKILSHHGIKVETGKEIKQEHGERMFHIYETLLEQGVKEQDAHVIVQEFQGVLKAKPVEIASKNQVYFLSDKQGRKKVLKFVNNKEEADIECLVNYHFSTHRILKTNIARGYNEIPIEVQVGDTKKHLVVQEDRRDKANYALQQMLDKGNKEQLFSYLNYWMRKLAEFHFYGTLIMNKLGNYAKARSIIKDADDERIKVGKYKHDPVLRSECAARDIEGGNIFIHQDLRYENRLCQTALDWGHAGRGNYLLDPVKLLSDSAVQKRINDRSELTEEQYKRLLQTYLNTMRMLKKLPEVELKDLNQVYYEFNAMRKVYFESQAAYYDFKGGECTLNEQATNEFMQAKQSEVEQLVRKHRLWRRETKNSIVYEFPTLDDDSSS
jgi:hypothetical protein